MDEVDGSSPPSLHSFFVEVTASAFPLATRYDAKSENRPRQDEVKKRRRGASRRREKAGAAREAGAARARKWNGQEKGFRFVSKTIKWLTPIKKD